MFGWVTTEIHNLFSFNVCLRKFILCQSAQLLSDLEQAAFPHVTMEYNP